MEKTNFGSLYLFALGSIAAHVYVLVTLTITISIASQQSVAYKLIPFAPILYLIGQLLERTRSTTTIIRRFGDDKREQILFEKVLPMMSPWSRSIWLTDQTIKYSPPVIYSPIGLYGLCSILPLYLIASVIYDNSLVSGILVLAASIPAHFMLIALSGNGSNYAIVAVAAFFFIFHSSHSDTSSIANIAGGIILIIILHFFLIGVQRLINRSLIKKKQVANRFDLGWLTAELWSPIWFLPRFIASGMSVVDQLQVNPKSDIWKGTIKRLIKRRKVVVAEVSALTEESGLSWEIEETARNDRRLLLVCQRKEIERVVIIVKNLLPDVPILGHGDPDIRTIRKWTNAKKKGWIHVLAYENEAELALRVFPVLEGFFRYTFDDWLRILYLQNRSKEQRITTFTAAIFHFIFGSPSFGNTMNSFLTLWQKLAYLHQWMKPI